VLNMSSSPIGANEMLDVISCTTEKQKIQYVYLRKQPERKRKRRASRKSHLKWTEVEKFILKNFKCQRY